MNQFFSLKRFQSLVLKHWADNKSRYTLAVLAFIGLLTAWFAFSLAMPEDQVPMSHEVQQNTFFFLFFVTGTLYASQYFSELSSRTKAGNFLLIRLPLLKNFCAAYFIAHWFSRSYSLRHST